MKNPQEKLVTLNIWSRNVTTTSPENPPHVRVLAQIYDVRMAQFVLKIEKLSHIMGSRESQDLRSPSPIMAPGKTTYKTRVRQLWQWYSRRASSKKFNSFLTR